MFDNRLKDFFSVYDNHGTFHNGFLQSIDLSSYVDLTIMNEITLNIMDSFIKNEIGNMKTMQNWNSFLTWDKETKKYIINSDFYETAKYTIYVYLLRSQRFYNLLNTDFRSLSAQETEQIVYGAKEEQKDYDKVVVNIERENDSITYGQELLTKSFGIFERETEFGNTRKDLHFGAKEKETEFGNTRKDFNFGVKETETEFGNTRKDIHTGAKEKETEFGNTRKDLHFDTLEKELEFDDTRKDLHYGNHETDTAYGATSETFNTGTQTNSSGTTNQTHPFDVVAFLDDTASSTSTSNGARQDTKSSVLHTDTVTDKLHEDYETTASRTDSETTTARDDYETTATHTDTTTETATDDYELNATHTDTVTESTHADYETSATHTDTVTETATDDYETNATHTDTETEKAHTDTETNASHTDTNTYGDVTNTTDNRTDVTTIKTHTDTKTKTKIILISPDKYFEIMKELMSYNVYDILINAIKDCFTLRIF